MLTNGVYKSMYHIQPIGSFIDKYSTHLNLQFLKNFYIPLVST